MVSCHRPFPIVRESSPNNLTRPVDETRLPPRLAYTTSTVLPTATGLVQKEQTEREKCPPGVSGSARKGRRTTPENEDTRQARDFQSNIPFYH